MSYLEDYYNAYDEEGRLLSRHGQVEYLTTMKYIRRCLASFPKPSVLEVGAGTGRYSVELCHQGYDVTAVELVPHNLEILRAKHENIKTWQGDARDLHFLEDETFDITLLFGPLYHLHGDEEKLKALEYDLDANYIIASPSNKADTRASIYYAVVTDAIGNKCESTEFYRRMDE